MAMGERNPNRERMTATAVPRNRIQLKPTPGENSLGEENLCTSSMEKPVSLVLPVMAVVLSPQLSS